jgi:hypothetical protein
MFIIAGRKSTRPRTAVLRTDQEITEALEGLDSSLEEDLLSRAGSISELSRWIGGELQLGKEKHRSSGYSTQVPEQ